MQVLFVCTANVGRSQMAEAFFNKLSKKNHASSAGIEVGDAEGESIGERVVRIMKELGYDLSKNTRKQITREMAEKADKIIVMAEKETIPNYLKKSLKVIFWDVPDAKGQSEEFQYRVRDQIKELVEELVEEIG